jgi:hypothetical protein
MSAPVTTVDSATGGVQISWVAPNNGQDTIDAYVIEIADSTSTWKTDTSCDGSTSTVIVALKCIVPMSTLTGASFNLGFDTLV